MTRHLVSNYTLFSNLPRNLANNILQTEEGKLVSSGRNTDLSSDMFKVTV